jgi:DNA-binding MarR family transcriptional regulator
LVPYGPPASERIGYLLLLCHDRIVGEVENHLSQIGITMPQYRLLWLIKSDRFHHNQTSVASKLGLTHATVSRMVSEMIELGWVRQVQNQANKREKFVRLTEAGKDLLAVAARGAYATQQQLVTHLSGDEQGELKRLLRRALHDENAL